MHKIDDLFTQSEFKSEIKKHFIRVEKLNNNDFKKIHLADGFVKIPYRRARGRGGGERIGAKI